MRPDDFIRRADELIAKCAAVRKTTKYSSDGIYSWVDSGQMSGLRGACLSFLASTFGEEHPYYTMFVATVQSSETDDLGSAEALLREAKEEVAGGWTVRLRALVAAEIFSDFADMAGYLLSEGYKDPAAVIMGSALEEHLRQLASRSGVEVTVAMSGDLVPKKADRLNSDLASATVYSKLDQKNVTAWLDLRNKAAHGRYSEYTQEQVDLMHRGVIDFMARTQ